MQGGLPKLLSVTRLRITRGIMPPTALPCEFTRHVADFRGHVPAVGCKHHDMQREGTIRSAWKSVGVKVLLDIKPVPDVLVVQGFVTQNPHLPVPTLLRQRHGGDRIAMFS